MLRYGQYVKLETIEDLVQHSGYAIYDSSVIIDDNYRAITPLKYFIDCLRQRKVIRIMFVECIESHDGSFVTGVVIDSDKVNYA